MIYLNQNETNFLYFDNKYIATASGTHSFILDIYNSELEYRGMTLSILTTNNRYFKSYIYVGGSTVFTTGSTAGIGTQSIPQPGFYDYDLYRDNELIEHDMIRINPLTKIPTDIVKVKDVSDKIIRKKRR